MMMMIIRRRGKRMRRGEKEKGEKEGDIKRCVVDAFVEHPSQPHALLTTSSCPTNNVFLPS